MSNPSREQRRTRLKVWRTMRSGEARAGAPIAEWTYFVPRYSNSATAGFLQSASEDIQLETMGAWFLVNHVPGSEPYMAVNIAIPGMVQYFDGRPSADIIEEEFSPFTSERARQRVSQALPGYWKERPDEPLTSPEPLSGADLSAILAKALEDFRNAWDALRPAHGRPGHNSAGADLSPVSHEEHELVLRATEDSRLAVLSEDYSLAAEVWETVKPILRKLGVWIGKQIDNVITKAGSAFGTAMGHGLAIAALTGLGKVIGLWSNAEAISALFEALKHRH